VLSNEKHLPTDVVKQHTVGRIPHRGAATHGGQNSSSCTRTIPNVGNLGIENEK
jgi:hypothetical protein